jgi:hypothetical protein
MYTCELYGRIRMDIDNSGNLGPEQTARHPTLSMLTGILADQISLPP